MKKFKKIFIVGAIIIFWAVFSAVYIYSNSNPTVISKDFNKTTFTKSTSRELLKGEKIQGEFRADGNYLGQISVRFYNYDRINSDSVIFRLKEKGASNWFYQNNYKTDQFQPNQLFPFGFPILPDSRGKQYDFEIESATGKPEDAVTLSPIEPMVSTSYQYPKRLLFKNKDLMFDFITKKISSIKLGQDFLVSFLTYLDSIFLLVVLLYLVLNYITNKSFRVKHFLEGSKVISMGIILLVFSFLLLYLKKPVISENISIASYFLLIAGTLFAVIESKRS